MEKWHKECLKKIEFTILKKTVFIELFIDNIFNIPMEFVYTPRYRPNELMPNFGPPTIQTLQLCGYTEKSEFINDILDHISCINKSAIYSWEISDYKRIIRDSCEKHIKQHGRLINIDLLVYIDALMHILWTLGLFTSSDEEKRVIYAECINDIYTQHRDYIYVAKPPYGLRKLTDIEY